MIDTKIAGTEIILEASEDELKRIKNNPRYERTTSYISTHDFVFALRLIEQEDKATLFEDHSKDTFNIVQRINSSNHILTASLLAINSGEIEYAKKIEEEQRTSFAVEGRPYSYPHLYRKTLYKKSESVDAVVQEPYQKPSNLKNEHVKGDLRFSLIESLYAAHLNAVLTQFERANQIKYAVVEHTWDKEKSIFYIGPGDSEYHGPACTTYATLRTMNLLGDPIVNIFLQKALAKMDQSKRNDRAFNFDYDYSPDLVEGMIRECLFFESFKMAEELSTSRRKLLELIGSLKQFRAKVNSESYNTNQPSETNSHNLTLIKAGIAVYGLPDNVFQWYIP